MNNTALSVVFLRPSTGSTLTINLDEPLHLEQLKEKRKEWKEELPEWEPVEFYSELQEL